MQETWLSSNGPTRSIRSTKLIRSRLGGRYRLDAVIASGGSSTVYRAHDVLLRRAVAVKLYRPNEDPVAQRKFYDEARVLARLSHPGLVAVYNADTEAGHPYLVLQLIDGPTLGRRLAGGPLAHDEVRRLGAQLAHALEYVHSRGVIHRDIKPSNVLLAAGAVPYLTDFGISRLVDGARVTRTGQFVGTASYLAPEQVRGADGGPPADVYALGLVLLECLTGRIAYAGGNEVTAAVARLSRAPHIPADLPSDLATLIEAMTSFDPRYRPSAAVCAAALAGPTPEAVLSAPPPAAVPQVVVSAPRFQRLKQRGVVAAAVCIVLLAAYLAWVLLGSGLHGTPTPASAPAKPPSVAGAVRSPASAPAAPVTAPHST